MHIDEQTTRRFVANIRFTADCWLWLGTCNHQGYGQISIRQRKVRVHRFAYTLCVGPIPEGLTLDHLCRVRNCVRPDHLEPVTQRINLLRGETIAARAARKTHCPQGHEYSPENTYRYLPKSGSRARMCRACDRDRHRVRYAKEKETAS